MKKSAKPIRVRTYWRSGTGTKLIKDKVLTPLTAAERKAGVRDEYGEYVAVHGEPGAKRITPRRVACIVEQGCGDARMDFILQENGLPSRNDQKEIFDMMYPHLRILALNMYSGGIIGRDEIHDMAMELYIDCLCSLKEWDPAKASLKTYMFECSANSSVDYIRKAKAKKRGYTYPHCRIVSDPVEDGLESPGIAASLVSTEKVADRHALEKMFFAWALADLEALLDPDESLALRYLLMEIPQEKIARWLGLTLMQFRRRVLQTLQMKAELCGFKPHNGTEICTR